MKRTLRDAALAEGGQSGDDRREVLRCLEVGA